MIFIFYFFYRLDKIPKFECKINAKEEFKNKIFRFLFDYRIYKNRDIKMFYSVLINKNSNLISEYEIRKVYEEAKRKLEE